MPSAMDSFPKECTRFPFPDPPRTIHLIDESETSTPAAGGKSAFGIGNHRASAPEILARPPNMPPKEDAFIPSVYRASAHPRAWRHRALWKKQSDAVFITRRNQHSPAFYPPEYSRSEVHDVWQLFADQFFRLFPLCDPRDYRPAPRLAEIHRAFDELVCLGYWLRGEHGADADVELR